MSRFTGIKKLALVACVCILGLILIFILVPQGSAAGIISYLGTPEDVKQIIFDDGKTVQTITDTKKIDEILSKYSLPDNDNKASALTGTNIQGTVLYNGNVDSLLLVQLISYQDGVKESGSATIINVSTDEHGVFTLPLNLSNASRLSIRYNGFLVAEYHLPIGTMKAEVKTVYKYDCMVKTTNETIIPTLKPDSTLIVSATPTGKVPK